QHDKTSACPQWSSETEPAFSGGVTDDATIIPIVGGGHCHAHTRERFRRVASRGWQVAAAMAIATALFYSTFLHKSTRNAPVVGRCWLEPGMLDTCRPTSRVVVFWIVRVPGNHLNKARAPVLTRPNLLPLPTLHR